MADPRAFDRRTVLRTLAAAPVVAAAGAALAWQNTAYNRPPHTSFLLGDGMSAPPQPSIYVP